MFKRKKGEREVMRKRWKRLAAIVGAAVLVVCQSEVFVKAAELSTGEGTLLQEEAGNGVGEAETVTVEDGNMDEDVENVEVKSIETQTLEMKNREAEEPKLLPVTNLRWNEKGQGLFDNPNSKACFEVYVFYNGDYENGRIFEMFDQSYSEGSVEADLYHYMDKSGTYEFGVITVYDGMKSSENSEISDEFTYTRPDSQLPQPNIEVSKDGVVSASLPDGSGYVLGTDYGFEYRLYDSADAENSIVQAGINEGTYDFSSKLEPGKTYYVKVRAISRDISRVADSDLSDMLPVNANTQNSSTSKKESAASTETIVPEIWKPTTPDEIRRYAAYSSEKAEYTADAKNAYTVVIQNAMQGKKCFDSFETVLDGYTIGRTYNILPSGKAVYKMDSRARITLTIPKELQKENRVFRMVCVTAEGVPVILDDLDSDSATITFETDTYYAFALIYKDAIDSK